MDEKSSDANSDAEKFIDPTKNPPIIINAGVDEGFKEVDEEEMARRRRVSAEKARIWNDQVSQIELENKELFPEPDFEKIAEKYDQYLDNFWLRGEQNHEEKLQLAKSRYEWARRQFFGNILDHQTIGTKEELIDTTKKFSESLTSKEPFFAYESLLQIFHEGVTLEDLQLYSQFAKIWQEKVTPDSSPDELKNEVQGLNTVIRNISAWGVSPRPPKRTQEDGLALVTEIGTFLAATKKLPADFDKEVKKELTSDIIGRDSGSHSTPEKVSYLRQIFETALPKCDPTTLKVLLNAATRYAYNHKFDPEIIQGFSGKLLEAIKAQDPQVMALIKGGNNMGMGENDFGIGDFECACYGKVATPENINTLLMIDRSIPTSDYNRFEQNRQDALAISGVFGVLRDFIHDQRPYVHDLLSEMVKYIDSGGENQTKLQTIVDKISYLDYHPDVKISIFNSEVYHRVVKDGKGEEIEVIKIIKRLDANTEPLDISPVRVNDEEINQLVENYQKDPLKETFILMTQAINEKIKQMIIDKEVGIEPDMISLLSWVEKESTKIINDLSFEDQFSAYKTPWFREIVKFSEMIYGQNYNQTTLDELMEKTSSVGHGDFKTAYNLIGKHIIERVNYQVTKYNADNNKDWAQSSWSGNLAHALIALIDNKPATTIIGKRLAGES